MKCVKYHDASISRISPFFSLFLMFHNTPGKKMSFAAASKIVGTIVMLFLWNSRSGKLLFGSLLDRFVCSFDRAESADGRSTFRFDAV